MFASSLVQESMGRGCPQATLERQEKCGKNLAKLFADFAIQFPGKRPQEILRKILHKFHEISATQEGFWIDTSISATDPPLFLGVHALSRSWGGSILSSFLVCFRSLLSKLTKTYPRIDLRSTPRKLVSRGVLLKRGDGLWLK